MKTPLIVLASGLLTAPPLGCQNVTAYNCACNPFTFNGCFKDPKKKVLLADHLAFLERDRDNRHENCRGRWVRLKHEAVKMIDGTGFGVCSGQARSITSTWRESTSADVLPGFAVTIGSSQSQGPVYYIYAPLLGRGY
ncbi:hypothetical protein COCSADRAFT_176510 [Bipolaris sorokiniana ND90Pr]|uniref:Uncharacterized protein n=1 Tax=Cochliobolus sativus (strain ND90Pr / ATCC 201652) TaxID=665912 RepID=M2SNI8_COCSN|nr:uncharacterized protein COCSADRAFT_176510 [Bipolaris sorokiniana ND90Pr]EMD58701.1 hypothetical protein COCSADRAFT_176510 [Bipolaris sorokiniana ND90Pr]